MESEFIKVTNVETEKDFVINKMNLDINTASLIQQKADILSKINGISTSIFQLKRIGGDEIGLKDITHKVNALFARINDDLDELKAIELEIDKLMLKVSSSFKAVGFDEDYSKRRM